MEAEDLKNSILQLAMEGKLVPQNPNDEPASVLLDRIREKKEKLIKEKKIRRNNNESFIFRKNGHFYEKIGKNGKPICIDEEIPFEIPDSWELCRLENIAQFNGGYAFKSSKFKDEGIRIIRISDFDENGFKNDKLVYYDEKKELDKFSLENNDILMAMTGGTVGKTLFVTELSEKMYVNQRVADIKISMKLNIEFIYKILQSNFIKKCIHQNKNSTNDNISMKLINSFIIPIPPYKEQIRILNKINMLLIYVNEYNDLKIKLDKLNSEFPDKLKSSILQEAIQGKLIPQNPNDEPASVLLERIRGEKERLIKEKKIKRNKNESYIFKENNHFYEKIGNNESICIDDEIPFDIPNSWTWCKFENIIELISGRDLKKTQYNESKQGIPYVTGASNIINNQLLINRWTDEPAVIAIKHDILLSCKGTIGKILILKEDKVHIARQIMSIRLIDETLINRDYIVIFLMYYVTNLINIAKSMIPGISRDDVLKINIPLPPLNEQKRIVNLINYLNIIIN